MSVVRRGERAWVYKDLIMRLNEAKWNFVSTAKDEMEAEAGHKISWPTFLYRLIESHRKLNKIMEKTNFSSNA